MNDEGYIKLFRKFKQWRWYTDNNVKTLFLHLLLSANWVTKDFEGITIKRGQYISGRKKLAREIGLSERQIRTAIDKLKSTNEIIAESTSEFTIFTVVNYDHYQSSANNSTLQSKPEVIKSIEQETLKQQELISPSEELIFLCERVLGVATHLITWLNECKYPSDWIKAALIATEEAGKSKCNPAYTRAILNSYAKQGGPPNDSNTKSRVHNNRSTGSNKSKFADHPSYKQS